MTIHEFLEKWHHPGGREWPEVEEFTIALDPHPSSYSERQPTSQLRFAVQCTVCTGIYPRIHESVESHALQSRASDDVIQDLLNRLDGALAQRTKKITERGPVHAEPHNPVLVIIAGAGFSAGFGLPVTAELKQLAAFPCDCPPSHLHELFRDMLTRFPLKEYLDGTIWDFEYLLTVWEGYRHQLGQIDERQEVAHQECYRRFIEQICCHLYRLSWAAAASNSHEERFYQCADWLGRAKERYDVRFVTFNYDLILEMLCKRAGFAFTYRERSNPTVIPIRKLHGSVNWLAFSGEISSANVRSHLLYKSTGQCVYAFPEVDRCPYGVSGDMPVVIAPLAGKSYRGVYEWVWTFAAQDILAADRILIVGYSFPPLDAFADYHLKELLKKVGKPVTYILPAGDAQNRVRKVLDKMSPTFISRKWQVHHFEDML